VPIFSFNGNVPRVGKGKLVSAGAVLATGQRAAVIPATINEEEFEKRLWTCFVTGQTLIALDNLSKPLYSDTLASGVAEDMYTIRQFGTLKENLKITNIFIVTATGNKLAIVKDLAPRTLMAEIVALVDDPESAEHSFDPVRRAEEFRGALVVAVLTILKAHILAGRPDVLPNGAGTKLKPFGSFEEWSAGPRAALVWLGEMDPVASVTDVKAADREAGLLAELIGLWDAAVGSRPVRLSELITVANGYQSPDTPGEHPLQEVLATICDGPITPGKLGPWIGYRKETVVGGKYLVAKVDGKSKVSRWTLVGGNQAAPELKLEPVAETKSRDQDDIPF
jgi:putative DNA primase/helicase